VNHILCDKETGMYSLRKFIFSCLVISVAGNLLCQNYEGHHYEEQAYFSFGVGSSGYYGDLQDELILPNYSLTAEVSKRVGSRTTLRGSTTLFRLSARDANSDYKDFQIRNLSFFSTHLELSAGVEFSLFRTYTFGLREKINPYFFSGIGGFNVSPKTVYNGEKYSLRKYKTEGVSYSSLGLAIPLGFGIKVKMNKQYTIAAEFGYRFTNTDYLDDVSTVYPDLEKMSSIARALSDRRVELGHKRTEQGRQRGNPDRNDGYFLFIIKIQGKVRDIF